MQPPPFVPLFRNPHLATIAGNFWPRELDQQLFPVAERYFDTEPGVKVLVHSQRPAHPVKAELVLVHGLEGSSESGYARSLAFAALRAGYAVHRFNMRSCGGTEAVCGRTLYHSGQTSDLLVVVRQLVQEGAEPVYLAGFSLGGNVVLKLCGELGSQARDLVAGICAVSTPIDLAACARRLGHPSNFLYERRFVTRLKDRVRLKERLTPGAFDLRGIDQVKTIFDFDDRFTAPSFGFGTAANYYATQSSNRFLGRIEVPCLVVHAKDDPLIPFEVYDLPAFGKNSYVRLLAVEHGGHLGFIARQEPRLWADRVILCWLNGLVG